MYKLTAYDKNGAILLCETYASYSLAESAHRQCVNDMAEMVEWEIVK